MTGRQEACLWLGVAVLLVGANLMGGGHVVGYFIAVAGLAAIWVVLHWMNRDQE